MKSTIEMKARARKLDQGKKVRLDLELVRRELAPSREKAWVLIMAGEIFVDGQKTFKSDKKISQRSEIEVRKRNPYVSRAAFKIKKAVEGLGLEIRGLNILDIGISTGGFSDYMLQQGASAVMGIDVNIDQVDYRLKEKGRLKLLKKNARYLDRKDIPFMPDLITIDVSFISVTRIMPALAAFPEAKILVLIKPQFEADKSEVKKGGVIRDREKIRDIILKVKREIEKLNFSLTGFIPAGIKGKKGNQEYFFLLEYGKKSLIGDRIIYDEIEI